VYQGLCGTRAVCVGLNVILRRDVYGAALCWRGVNFVCVLLFCVVVINGVKYRVLEVKWYFVHVFILLMCATNMEFFKAVHMSSFLVYLYCVLYDSVRVTRV
jgi:hypothetical protein